MGSLVLALNQGIMRTNACRSK